MTLAEPRNDCSENARTAGSALIEITDDDVMPAGPSSPVAVMIETPAGWFRYASTKEFRMDGSASTESSETDWVPTSFVVTPRPSSVSGFAAVALSCAIPTLKPRVQLRF